MATHSVAKSGQKAKAKAKAKAKRNTLIEA